MYRYAFLFLTVCFLALTGCDETNENGPDLIVTDLVVTSWTSETIAYSFTITNNGNEPADLDGPTEQDFDNVSVQAFLSADTLFNNSGDIAAGGTIVGLSPLGELDPGESITGSFSASAVVDPAATPYLVLMADWGNVVDETQENNNTLAVEIPQPDLVVSSLIVNSWTSSSIEYTFTITNNGNAAANLDGPTDADHDNVSVQAFLSGDTLFNNAGDIAAGGTVVGLSPLGTLEPGESLTGTFGASAVVDPYATPYLILKVDWGDVVDESDEDNNTLAVEIPIQGLPDLVVSSLTVDTYDADSITYSYTITNVGDAPAYMDGPTEAATDNVKVQAFLSGDTVFNNNGDIAAGGTVVSFDPVGELEPGEAMSGTFTSTVTVDPETMTYLVLMVDWNEVVDESDENNNTLATVIMTSPDLEVTELEVTSWTSGSIQYAFTITNTGDGPANMDGPTDAVYDNVKVQAFLSADTVFNNSGDIPAGGTVVSMTDLGDLEPGASISGSFGASAAVDPSATPYLVLKVDWGNVVDEADEDNNTLAAEITETGLPDLVVTSLAITSMTAGTIQYEYTITNIGDAPANLDGPTEAEYDNVSIQAFLSNDTVFNTAGDSPAGGTILGYSPLGELAPGESMDGSFAASTKVDPSTMNYLTIMVDWGASVVESDETNNTCAAPVITIQ